MFSGKKYSDRPDDWLFNSLVFAPYRRIGKISAMQRVLNKNRLCNFVSLAAIFEIQKNCILRAKGVFNRRRREYSYL